MHSKWVFKHFRTWTRRRIRCLAALWVLGILAGIFWGGNGSYDSAGTLSAAMSVSPSPLGLFLVCFLPIAFVAVALASPLFQLSYLAVFLGAVAHGFCGISVYMTYGSAAWLLRPLLLFSASCTATLVWWLLLQSANKSRLRRNIRRAGVFACFIYMIDLFLVSPFVGDLAKYF